MVGYVATTSAEFPINLTDNASYQNFGIIAGSIVGFIICLAAHIFYTLRKRSEKSLGNRFIMFLCAGTGSLIGLFSSLIVQVSANSFGMINASVGMIVIGCSISAIIGGVVPAETLMLTRY
ncbi:MAG: hypothetical protein A2Z74_07355 [Chloroflexi bacterium RBG_13_46_9]|nr:MAG: hypothetical protein A2Z74_07355 [Chloroflexi bacterium RBG_13_46_9]